MAISEKWPKSVQFNFTVLWWSLLIGRGMWWTWLVELLGNSLTLLALLGPLVPSSGKRMDTCPNACQQKGWPPLRVCKCERGEAPVSNRTCDPSTIKGAKFSLLCCQPEAIPQSSGTLNLKFALMTQCPPLTWNGQVFLQTPGTLFLTPPTIPLSRVLAHYRGCPPTWSIFYVYFQCLSCIYF